MWFVIYRQICSRYIYIQELQYGWVIFGFHFPFHRPVLLISFSWVGSSNPVSSCEWDFHLHHNILTKINFYLNNIYHDIVIDSSSCLLAVGLFWDIATGLPWTPNGVGSLEPRGFCIFLPGAHYLTINSPHGADSSLNKLLLLLLLHASWSWHDVKYPKL